jgi:hypothetical protein
VDEIDPHRRSLQGRRGRSHVVLRRTISRDGFCATDSRSESLRDIEISLAANPTKLYAMGAPEFDS